MAHNLHKDTMLYVGEVPWHGLGVKLPANATWEQVVELGGFYEVGTEDVLVASGRKVPGRKAIVRKDTGAPLSVVSDSYEVVQFSEVAETLVKAAGSDAVFHTAGLLGADGSRGWLLAELPRVIRVKGDSSEIRPYILGTTAHDGRNAVMLRNVATRVVCQNTLGAALNESGAYAVTIHHNARAHDRLDMAREAFAALSKGMVEFEELANFMASTRFGIKRMRATLDALLPVPEPKKGEELTAAIRAAQTRAEEKRELVLKLFESGTGIDSGIRGTAWGAFQALTEYADHFGHKDPAKRLNSVWLGAAANFKAAALANITSTMSAAA